MKAAREKQGRTYNKKVRGSSIAVGDLVLVKNVGLKGKQKLADKWKSDIHIVIDQPCKDVPVFVVRPENGSGERTLHRNLLLPLTLPWQQPKYNLQAESDNEDVDSDDSDNSDFVVGVNVSDPIPDIDVHANTNVDNVDIVHDNVNNEVADHIPDDSSEKQFELNVDADIFIPAVEMPSVSSPDTDGAGVTQAVDSGEDVIHHDDDLEADDIPLRRSGRSRKPPVHLRDYVCQSQRVELLLDWQIKVSALLQQ